MDLLKRNLAPITPEAWQQIDDEAKRVLQLRLVGRTLVDVDGPHGWQYAAVNTGRLAIKSDGGLGVPWGIREVLPLVELRISIELSIMDLDGAARGALLDLAPVVTAAERIARAEDLAIFHGFKPAGIEGMVAKSPHAAITIPDDWADYPLVVVEAVETLRRGGINGPYALALGPDCYAGLSQAAEDGYPIRDRVQHFLDGPIVWAPQVDGAVVLSTRGGDFKLTIGQDLSIGYVSHTREKVELYLAESFAFRVIEPGAAVHLKPKRGKK